MGPRGRVQPPEDREPRTSLSAASGAGGVTWSRVGVCRGSTGPQSVRRGRVRRAPASRPLRSCCPASRVRGTRGPGEAAHSPGTLVREGRMRVPRTTEDQLTAGGAALPGDRGGRGQLSQGGDGGGTWTGRGGAVQPPEKEPEVGLWGQVQPGHVWPEGGSREPGDSCRGLSPHPQPSGPRSSPAARGSSSPRAERLGPAGAGERGRGLP